MAECNFDQYQNKAINIRENSVVCAGAGSGKTTVLAERFAALVLDKKNKVGVDQILTLTFTKKATVEMSARIYKVLKKYDPKKAADFYKANIKTLDKYCNTVAKMGCHYYGISPDFIQDKEKLEKDISSMALPFILEHRDNEAIKALVHADNFDSIAKKIFVDSILDLSTIAEPIDFDSMLHNQVKEIVYRWNTKLKEIHDTIIDIKKMFNEIPESNKPSKTLTIYKEVLENSTENEIPELCNLSIQDIENYNIDNATNYLIAIGKIVSLPRPGNTNVLKPFLPDLNKIKNLYPEICSIFNFMHGYNLTTKLIPLLKKFQDKINRYKRSTGILNFKDVSNLAKCILRDYPEIRQIEKEKYKFIMIDEFQDNNKDQKDMLFMLAEKLTRNKTGIPEVNELEKEKLFFVGDEKQSIYRFRGADVSVFNSLSQDFIDGNLNMTTNYRSDSALIKSFNTIFGGYEYPLQAAPITTTNKTDENIISEIPSVFFNDYKNYNIEIPNYEAKYKEVLLPEEKQKEALDKSKEQTIFKPHIHFALFDKDQENSNENLSEEEAEAQWVSEKINELTTKGINNKVYKYSDIAILIRKYSIQPLYERAFLRNDIPYNTETTTDFFSDGPINDIVSILQLCAYPNDTVAYAQILRSPWVNLSIEQVNEILFLKTNNDLPFSQEVENILPKDALLRYKHAKSFFEELNESAKIEPLTKTITKIWYSTGYRYETLWNKTLTLYGKLYDIIFELARQAEENKMTLASFVDDIRVYKDPSKKIENMDIPFIQTNGVHILTIHKSKGLEYPIVFIIGTHKPPKANNDNGAIFASKTYGITINTPQHPIIGGENTFFQEAKKEDQIQQAAELRRLTYVALTRAKEHVFITNGKYKFNKNYLTHLPENEGNPTTIFNILEPIYNYYFLNRDDENISGPFSRTFINSNELQTVKNDVNTQEAKIKLLKKIEENKVYEKAKTISKDFPSKTYANPSQLYKIEDKIDENSNDKKIIKNACKEYEKINVIIESTIPKHEESDDSDNKTKKVEPTFTNANFGTIVHAYLEAKIKKIDPIISNKDFVGLEDKTKSYKEIQNICKIMAEKFENSNIGRKAITSKWKKAEYEFRSRIQLDNKISKILKGTIDLVFKNEDESYTIVDYKTNQDIKPEIYYAQLACYKQAISQMLNIDSSKINCILYYLRYDKAIDITKETDSVDLYEIIKNLPL